MEFYASDVERICEIKRNRLEVWMKAGWITPSIQVASGHGTRNIFHETDLVVILIFKHFVETGMSRKWIGELKGHIDKVLVEELKGNKSTIERLLRAEPIPHKTWLYYLIHPTELIPFQTVMVPEADLYYLFYRKGGKVVSSGALTAAQRVDSDDVIGINLHKIISKVVDKIEQG